MGFNDHILSIPGWLCRYSKSGPFNDSWSIHLLTNETFSMRRDEALSNMVGGRNFTGCLVPKAGNMQTKKEKGLAIQSRFAD